MPRPLANFTPIEWLSFLIDIQSDRNLLASDSCISEDEAVDFNMKVHGLREFFLTLAVQDETTHPAPDRIEH